MDHRFTVLETRFDTILPTLATKADIEGLRAEFRVQCATDRAEFRGELEKLRGDFQFHMEKLRGDVQFQMEKLRGDLQCQIERLRGDTQTQMETLRADLFKAISDFQKWVVGILITGLLGIMGINIAMYNSLANLVNTSIARLEATLARERLPAVAPKAPRASSEGTAPVQGE